MSIHIEVRHGNVLEYRADVLALKFAQDLYGVDQRVVTLLAESGTRLDSRLPPIGQSLLVGSEGVVAVDDLLFVGVEPLGRFEYGSIREFSRRVLSVLAESRPATRHVAMTLHGRGFGLDEAEALRAEVAGILDAIDSRQVPPVLRTISIVERDPAAAERMQALLATIIPLGASLEPSLQSSQSHVRGNARTELGNAGHDSQAKPLVFVAMPFAEKYADLFHYGIRGAVNAAGFLCERADLASFTGDVIAWVKQRIDNASLVVADLTSANPNVYLEVGYAWGRGVDTVLLLAHGEELKFDVRTQRCLVFRNIRHLEELLTTELTALKETSSTGRRQRI
jgi:hypothetical protein